MVRTSAKAVNAAAGLALAAAVALAGCSSPRGYYRQAISGQLELMRDRQDIDRAIASESTPADLRRQLELATDLVAFAGTSLGLPDNGSYQAFVDVGRPFVVWNVVAAPPLSLNPLESCFPVVGCVAYRGFFDPSEAEAHAETLRAEGYDILVGGSSAYSTLGWFNDPVPSTILFYPDYALAGTIFHELAHQRVFVAGDATFNESYSVAVEQAGVEIWLAQHGTPTLKQAYEQSAEREEAFLALVLAARAELETLYTSALDEAAMVTEKAKVFDGLRSEYAALRASWGGYSGYDAWFADDLNNAKLALVITYNSYVEAFLRLLADSGDDWETFHAAVETLSELPPVERQTALRMLSERAP